MEKPVYIFGAGAIGKALAVFLQLEGRQVVLIRGSVDDGKRSLQSFSVTLEERTLQANIEVNTLSYLQELDGPIVIAVKSFGNEQLARQLKSKTGNSPVVLLQNGLEVEQPFIDHDFPELYRCVLFVTSQVNDDNTLRFKPVSDCPIGPIKGSGVYLKQVTEKLSKL